MDLVSWQVIVVSYGKMITPFPLLRPEYLSKYSCGVLKFLLRTGFHVRPRTVNDVFVASRYNILRVVVCIWCELCIHPSIANDTNHISSYLSVSFFNEIGTFSGLLVHFRFPPSILSIYPPSVDVNATLYWKDYGTDKRKAKSIHVWVCTYPNSRKL